MGYRPTWKDRFWTKAHGSGVVHAIHWEDRVVEVKFYDKHREEYPFDDLDGKWRDSYGGHYRPEE